jgi:hypothetical protein
VDREAEAIAPDRRLVQRDDVHLVPELVQPAGEVVGVSLDAADAIVRRHVPRDQADPEALRGTRLRKREQRRR